MYKLVLFIILTNVFDTNEFNLSNSNYLNHNARRQAKILNRVESSSNFDDETAAIITTFLNSSKLPCAVLIGENKLENTLIKLLLRSVNNELWLMKFNDTGVSSILTKSKDEITEEILQETGERTKFGHVAFFAIIQAIRALPAGATILIFVDGNVLDEDLSNLAVKEMLENHITLYVIWEGTYPTTTNEESLLKQAAVLSGGNFFSRKLNNENTTNTKEKSIVVYRKKLHGLQKISFPVDSKITGMYVTITTDVYMARLRTPYGYLVDLLEDSDVKKFSRRSESVEHGGEYKIYLDTTTNESTPVAGIWRLDVSSDNAHGCNLTISVQNDLKVYTQLVDKYKKENKGETNEETLKLNIIGDFDKIENIAFVNQLGEDIKQNVPFTIATLDDVELVNQKEVTIRGRIANDVNFVKINGLDLDGNEFVRIARYEVEKVILPSVTVNVRPDSELYLTPNKYSNVYFEVTNNGPQAISVEFSCRDEKWLLQWMTPRGANINPNQTITVTVNVLSPIQPTTAYTDTITLIINGNVKAEKATLLYVNTAKPSDTESPNLWYKFTSDCLNVASTDCQDSSWTIEATAQDIGTGLLSLTSTPSGIYFPNTFVTGSKDEVKGIYSDSCCNTQLELQAIDLSNNKRILAVDAISNASFSGWIIGAIVLSVLLFAVLIATSVLIVRYRKKQTVSIDLPTYRAPSGSRANI